MTVNDDARPSKTQRKKEMLALQDLGAELAELDEARLAALALPENLLDALREAGRINGFEARRRHMQYVGKLMRGVDPSPIRAQLEAWKIPSRRHSVLLARADHWRTLLLADKDAVALFCSEHPRVDARELDALVESALRERESGRRPASFRALYHVLRDALLAHDAERERRDE